jgi:thiamine monophosphate kinase
VCGETLARGHARAGDPCLIAGYIGNSERFDEAIAKFAADYAAQTERDWQALLDSLHRAKPRASAKRAANRVAPATGKRAGKKRMARKASRS